MPTPSQAKSPPAKRSPKFKACAARMRVKRGQGGLVDSLPKVQQEFLREKLIEQNLRYAEVVELFNKRFGRRLTTSTLSRWFTLQSRPKAATHDEITVNFSLRFTVPKGSTVRFNTSEVSTG